MKVKKILFIIHLYLGALLCNAETTIRGDAKNIYLNALEHGSTVPALIGYKNLKDGQGHITRQRIIYLKNDLVKHATYILDEFRSIPDNRLIGISKIDGPFGVWFFKQNKLIKSSNDFIQAGLFSIKEFNALPSENSIFSIKISGMNDSADSIIIERILSEKQQKALKRMILRDYKFIYWLKINENQILQDMPIRALFRISKSSGLIIEDSYFSEKGKLVGKFIDFDRIEIPSSLDDSLFLLPVGKTIYFPKNGEETWGFFKEL